MTAVAIVLGAVALLTALDARRRAMNARRLADQHEEALRLAAMGSLEALADVTRETPPLTGDQLRQLRRAYEEGDGR